MPKQHGNSNKKPVKFDRPKKYQFIAELGRGACGETVHLHDEDIQADFVAKKFSPVFSKDQNLGAFNELFDRFREEARLLFKINHPNIVRVYNFFDYREADTAYIIMEYINGSTLIDAALSQPDRIARFFEQSITAFAYLESKDILHRDIRPQNILISQEGQLKVIDFGFGKAIEGSGSVFDKSVSLTHWCEPPNEYGYERYDFQTEIYYVGKIFELAIQQSGSSEFPYSEVLAQMCSKSAEKRPYSFSEIQTLFQSDKIQVVDFSEDDKFCYRDFADSIVEAIARIEKNAKYVKDVDQIVKSMRSIHRQSLLENYIYSTDALVRCFISGGFYFRRDAWISTDALRGFIQLLESRSSEAQAIILANLHGRFDRLARYQVDTLDDDIPF